jgi:hypothetical protein
MLGISNSHNNKLENHSSSIVSILYIVEETTFDSRHSYYAYSFSLFFSFIFIKQSVDILSIFILAAVLKGMVFKAMIFR